MIKSMTKKMNNKKGFTLIELIVVIAILGILAAIAIPRFATVTTSAKNRAVEANHRIMVSAVQMSMAETGGSIPSGTDDDAIKAIIAPFIEGGISETDPPATYTFTGTVATADKLILTAVMTETDGKTFTQEWTR